MVTGAPPAALFTATASLLQSTCVRAMVCRRSKADTWFCVAVARRQLGWCSLVHRYTVCRCSMHRVQRDRVPRRPPIATASGVKMTAQSMQSRISLKSIFHIACTNNQSHRSISPEDDQAVHRRPLSSMRALADMAQPVEDKIANTFCHHLPHVAAAQT